MSLPLNIFLELLHENKSIFLVGMISAASAANHLRASASMYISERIIKYLPQAPSSIPVTLSFELSQDGLKWPVFSQEPEVGQHGSGMSFHYVQMTENITELFEKQRTVLDLPLIVDDISSFSS